MIVGVPKEASRNERRVALVPGVVSLLIRAGLEVVVEAGAGAAAGFRDSAYLEQGARVARTREEIFSNSDLLIQVRAPSANPDAGRADLGLAHSGQAIVGFLDPLGAPEAVQDLAGCGLTAFALELVPRIARAQSMDALTSMATIAGYKAVLLAAEALPRMFPMMITAAGTVSPARVLVIGAGVAGLQAIATARRLGAVVWAHDVRPAVREQVESLGAKFLETDLETARSETTGGYARAMDDEFYRRQREILTRTLVDSDVVITTAAVPGSRAPLLITADMVGEMQPGSVIVDLAAETGGNCELTRPGETVDADGVVIMGPVNLPSTIPYHASQMYGRNVTTFLLNLVRDGELHLRLDDQVIRETLITHRGEVVSSGVRELLSLPPLAPPLAERTDV